jgi:hypothetical protein
MKIRLTEIPADKIVNIQGLVDALREASNAGDMDAVDKTTAELISLTSKMNSTEVSGEQWKQWVATTRANNPDFQSDYLIPIDMCKQFFSEESSGSMVLHLPIEEQEDDDV